MIAASSRHLSVTLIACLSLASAASSTAWGAAKKNSGPKLADFAKQLQSDDEAVRAKAAETLAESKDEGATKLLCDTLADRFAVVKIAAANALAKRERPAALPCLLTAERGETYAPLKLHYAKTIDSLLKSKVPAPPTATKKAKHFVVVEIVNKSKRTDDEIEALVRGTLQPKLADKPGVIVASATASLKDNERAAKSKKLRGMLITITVSAPSYDKATGLTQNAQLLIQKFPHKAIIGEVPIKMNLPETPVENRLTESLVLTMTGETIADEIEKVLSVK